MKIWVDILTPKQLLFFEQMTKGFSKHKILYTSRRYGEVSKLARIRGIGLTYVGRFGGGDKSDKLKASLDRLRLLAPRISEFGPDLTISSYSPEAARISFGLGIRHIMFIDTPHAYAILRLTVPLATKVLTPFVIPKKTFTVYGIPAKDIVQYKAIDAAVTIRRKSVPHKLPFAGDGKKKILIRPAEEKASYTVSDSSMDVVREITDVYGDQDIVVLGRYPDQIAKISKAVAGKAKVVSMSHDGKYLLENTDVFVGSGGTMTAESALLGVPTVSYSAVPNVVEDFLVNCRLVTKHTGSYGIAEAVGKALESKSVAKRAENVLRRMENPANTLAGVMEQA